MKKLLLPMFVFCLYNTNMHAQTSPAENVAGSIADKTKDSLQLSPEQREKIFSVNMQLHNLKQEARNQWQSRDSVSRALQRIENTRDSLYRPILTRQQFELYRQKKRILISVN